MTTNRNQLREQLREQRQQLSTQDQLIAASQIAKTLSQLPSFQLAKNIALYFAHNAEVNTSSIFQIASEKKKQCFFPVIVIKPQEHLIFLPHTPGEMLKKNQFAIPEPDKPHEQAIELTQLDIIFMPLLGFDTQGNRLGMGAGYYDKTLAPLRDKQQPKLIGLAYECQRVDCIEPQSWDIPLHGIITEQKIYWT